MQRFPSPPESAKDPVREASPDDGLTAIQRRRLQDRKEWDAYWQIRKMDAEGKIVPTFRYYGQRIFDWPITWVREKIVEPMQDRYRIPYYHRKLTRVPDIDQCGVTDHVCIYEANEQYRLDKMVDTYIMNLLKERFNRCVMYNEPYVMPCGPLLNQHEEAELNWFIKYGELGSEASAVDVLMKQKHRMIWERRHPEIMEERQRAYEEHMKQLAEGEYNHAFWKKGIPWMDKKNYMPPYDLRPDKAPWEADQPLSKDWRYYKKVQEDPEFDKEQGKTSGWRWI